MDLSAGLDNAFARIANEHAARSMEARAQRLREAGEHAPVKFGKAQSQHEERQKTDPIDPSAVYEPLQHEDKGKRLDVSV
ncbi:hypothetical protein [Terricaulis sp.]|uniref:hypothetical protein n=1 Tax=Terricaulis sp. TaxID=2768686 RepID=UPI003783D477